MVCVILDSSSPVGALTRRKHGLVPYLALLEDVAIIKGDKLNLVVLSYEEYKNLRHKAGIQQALHVSELTEEDIEMITESKMPPELDYLNEEMEDK